MAVLNVRSPYAAFGWEHDQGLRYRGRCGDWGRCDGNSGIWYSDMLKEILLTPDHIISLELPLPVFSLTCSRPQECEREDVAATFAMKLKIFIWSDMKETWKIFEILKLNSFVNTISWPAPTISSKGWSNRSLRYTCGNASADSDSA